MAEEETPLVGVRGRNYILTELSKSKNVQGVLTDIQRRGALKNEDCEPLLGIVSKLGMTRVQAHQYVFEQATKTLLERVRHAGPDRLHALLKSCFDYVAIPQLRSISVAVLSLLQPVPKPYLELLAQDTDLFWELPLEVQRQVWEIERNTLQQHVLPLQHVFYMELDSLRAAHDMLTFLPGPGSARGLTANKSRQAMRLESPAISRLVEMIGSSRQVYKGVVDLLRAKWAAISHAHLSLHDLTLCSLRFQLLMALHDRQINEICRAEPIHKLVWTLDACLRDKAISAARMAELRAFFDVFSTPDAAPGGGRGKKRRKGRDDDAESQGGLSGAGLDDSLRTLADAAMVLRDPCVFNLLALEVIRRLYTPISRDRVVPRDDSDVVLLARLMQLASEAQTFARNLASRHDDAACPPPNEGFLGVLLPALTGFIVDSRIQQLAGPAAAGGTNGGKGGADGGKDGAKGDRVDANQIARITSVLKESEVARRVAQAFVIERVKRDARRCTAVLEGLAQAMAAMSWGAMAEWGPFAASLSRQLLASAGAAAAAGGAAAAAAGGAGAPAATPGARPKAEAGPSKRKAPPQAFVAVGDAMWDQAVEANLLFAADSGPIAHREVLELLVGFKGSIGTKEMAQYLSQLYQNTKLSRKRFAKHISRLLRDAGTKGQPASDGHWEALQPDGVKPLYSKALDTLGPDVKALISKDLLEYVSPEVAAADAAGSLPKTSTDGAAAMDTG